MSVSIGGIVTSEVELAGAEDSILPGAPKKMSKIPSPPNRNPITHAPVTTIFRLSVFVLCKSSIDDTSLTAGAIPQNDMAPL